MKSFPCLEDITIWPGNHTSCTWPYKDIFRFWPNLKHVYIRGQLPVGMETSNFDADFCGIYQEELELLRDKGEEYLEKVQIVPVRPCLSTMKGTP